MYNFLYFELKRNVERSIRCSRVRYTAKLSTCVHQLEYFFSSSQDEDLFLLLGILLCIYLNDQTRLSLIQTTFNLKIPLLML